MANPDQGVFRRDNRLKAELLVGAGGILFGSLGVALLGLGAFGAELAFTKKNK